MKKRTISALVVLVLLAVALATVIIPGAATESINSLDVSSGEGVVFDGKSLYSAADDNCMTEIPVTYEAWVKAPAGYNREQGTILGNYDGLEKNGVRFRGFTYGRTYLFFNPIDGGGACHFYFNGTNVSNSEWTHIAIVDDTVSEKALCYINGELAASITMTEAQKKASRDFSVRPMCIGGDYIVDTDPFVGNIRSVVVYSDVRTAEEIKADMSFINLDDENLISAYNLNGKQGAAVIEDATGNYDMYNNRATSDWVDAEQIPAVEEFSYSIALVGDTQILSGYYPELYHTYFDWLLANKDEHKIAHVLNLGDFTNFNYDWEWDNIREEWFRLNGKLDYTLVRGDHDFLNDKNASTAYDADKYDMWFNVPEYTDRFTNSEDADYYKGENGSMTNSYRAIDINGNKYLIVTVDKYPSEDVMGWLDTVINKYPDRRVIMTMHCFADNDGSYLPSEGSYKLIGVDFWERVKGYRNIEMIISGHQYAWGVTWHKDKGTNGNVVNQVLVNPQGPDFDQAGPTGMIAMLYFSEDGNEVQVRYYSPILDKYYIANYNEIINGYDIETSAFTMRTDDMSTAKQIKKSDLISYETADSANTSITVEASVNGASANVAVNYATSERVENGKVTLFYNKALLSAPNVVWVNEPADYSVQNYGGIVIVSWSGFDSSTSGKLFDVEFTSSVTSSMPTVIELRVDTLNYTDNDVVYVFEDVKNTGCIMSVTDVPTVTYGEGDDFEAKFEYALEIAKYSDVQFVMSADFVATKTIVLGSESFIPSHKVKVTSSDTANRVTLKTGGFNLVFWGHIEFSNIKMDGNGTTSANTYFFPDSTSVIVGANVNCGSSRANIAGANLTLNSGVWYVVSAINDYSVIDGYIDRTVKDDGNRPIHVNNPVIIMQGTSRTINLYGGAATDAGKSYSKDGTIFVLGKSTVKILDSARVETLATASGYGDYSTHDGEIYVNTTSTVKRLAAAVGPVGRDEFNHTYYPSFELIVDNVTMNEEYGFVGLWARSDRDNTGNYANVSVTINGGTFDKDSYGGVFASGADYTKFYGTNTVTINGGKFNGKVFGGGFLNGASSAPATSTAKITDQAADTYFTINGGEFAKNVNGGSDFRQKHTNHSGDTYFTINNGKFTNYVWGGSYFTYSDTNVEGAVHSGNIKTVINGGDFTAQIAGGSEFGGAKATHSGDTILEIKDGTFGTSTNVYGGAAVYGFNSRLTGDSTLNIYGGVALKGNVYGGSNLQKWGANGFPSSTSSSTGILASGNVYFNVYDYDKNGNRAVATFDTTKVFVAGSRIHMHYGEMTGDIYYSITGVTLPGNASAAVISDWDSKLNGDIIGTLENVTLTNNFFGGAIITGSRSIHSGNIMLTLKSVNVNGVVTAGSQITNANQTYKVSSTLNYESGTVNGKIAGGCYFTVPNIKAIGDSKLVFGTSSAAPAAKAFSVIIGGSLASDSAITSAGTTDEWGMYGNSELVINKGTVESGAYVVGGSYLPIVSTPSTTVNWSKYPVVGGVSGAETVTKLTINGGTVNGPKLYAGSYLASGGQDHGTVVFEINNGTVNISTTGITNYGETATFAISPVTYYPSNTKDLNCNYVLSLNGGSHKITTTGTRIGICAGLYGYDGDIIGDTTLNLNVGTRAGSNFNNTVNFVTAAHHNFKGVMTGDSTLNVGTMPNSSYDLYCISSVTYGCHGANDIADVAGDGIKYGFRQIGDAYLNVTGGTIARPVYMGYRSNLLGNVYVNISGGNINGNLYGGAANASSTTYASVKGDVVWDISGGVFNASNGIYGGGYATASFGPSDENNVVDGDIFVEVSGGKFNGILSLGGYTGMQSDNKASLKFVGSDYVISSTAKIFAHGNDSSDASVAPDSCYTLDLIHIGDKAESVKAGSSKFGKVLMPLEDGTVISLSNIEFANGTVLSDFMKGQTLTVNGESYTYDDIVYFDKYTEYDNTFDFYTYQFGTEQKVEKVDVFNKMALGRYNARSGEITLTNTSRDTGIQQHISGVSLTLSDSIAINMAGKNILFDNYTDVKVKVIFNGEEYLYEAPTTQGDTTFQYSFTNVGPQMMGDVAYFMIYAKNANGDEVTSGILNSSVRKYALQQMGSAGSAAEFKTVCMDILNYGAAAQTHTNYKTDALVNTGSDVEAFKVYASAEEAVPATVKQIDRIDGPAVSVRGASLYLGNNVELRYSFTTEENLEDLHAVVEIGEDTVFTVPSSEFTVSDNIFTVVVNELNPAMMRDAVKVTIMKGETQVSYSVTYSVASYVYDMAADTTTLLPTLKAMLTYGDAVAAWQA